LETEKMMSPSALYLTCVSARSCPERRIGLIFAVDVGWVGTAGLYGEEVALANLVTLDIE
jgi:hypothetical protein